MNQDQVDSSQQSPTLRFLGAAGTVTGSKYLIEVEGQQLLLDCGLFQGLKALRLRNWEESLFDAAALTAVVLSHAHLDHSGYLPVLAREGFSGPIYCTPATADLLAVLLSDSAHLMEEEASHANRHGYSKHHPALPLYTMEDVNHVLTLLKRQPVEQPFSVCNGVTATLRRSGHILGAASVDLLFTSSQKRLVFSGDLGRWDRPILRNPALVKEADVLLVESTYGDRLHAADSTQHLARVIRQTYERGGTLLIPAFAVGRVQDLLWILGELADSGQIPKLPVFVDSPMALDVTEIYRRHTEEYNPEMLQALQQGRSPFHGAQHRLLRTVVESKSLNDRTDPMIIIAGNGMITGGRILHHLEQRLPNPNNAVLLVGYQAAGTRGRSLQEGATELRMHGHFVPVRARIEAINGLSAHGDQAELMRWLSGFERPPTQTYVVHGEPEAAAALAKLISEQLDWQVAVARDDETIFLDTL